eukprot:TRINITY_DN72251_c0_g1_i1.p1 TRINITY_DN72251_c0_g1~~TRINITY_DN72251_c0_g1_i1.p1  ORF type:complete len:366 (-),score=51.08 TRINITY_DN72251_c0_g1_i1:62-1159(-)
MMFVLVAAMLVSSAPGDTLVNSAADVGAESGRLGHARTQPWMRRHVAFVSHEGSVADRQGTGGFMHRAQSDRSGSALGKMLSAQAWAAEHGVDYLGVYFGAVPGADASVCSADQIFSSQQVLQQAVQLFGDEARTSSADAECQPWAWLRLPPEVRQMPQGAVVVRSREELETHLATSPEKVYVIDDANPFETRFPINDSAKARDNLRSKISFMQPRLWNGSTSALRVALHVRREDLFQCQVCTNLLPNGPYLEAMNRIRKIRPDAQFIVFSQEPFSADKDGYRREEWNSQANITFRFDGPIVEAWDHMALADVLVHGDSSFVAVPQAFAASHFDLRVQDLSAMSDDALAAAIHSVNQTLLRELPR